MADNVTLNAGSGGAVMATDDDGTAQHQYVKVEFGADNTQTKVTSSAGLPVTPDSGGFTVDLGATDNAVLDSIEAHLVNLENCIVQDDAPFTPATGYLMMIGGEYDDSATDSVDEGDAGNVRITANRSMHMSLRDGAGNERGANVNASNQLEVSVENNPVLGAGTNAIGKLAANSGVDIGDVDVTSVPQPSSHYRNIDANAEDEIKGSAGTLYWIHAINLTAAIAYLHLYDNPAASVTPGSTTPDFTFPIPTQGDTNGAGFNLNFGPGHSFANGITLVVTTTTDGSAGDPGTNGVMVNAGYA